MKLIGTLITVIVKHKRVLINIVFPTLVASLFILLSFSSMIQTADTIDEKFHITRGVMLLETGDMRINQHHPYLFNYIAALPTILDDDINIPSTDLEIWQIADKDALSFELVEINGGRTDFTQDVLYGPRLMMLCIAVIFSLFTYYILLSMFGGTPAILFTTLLMLDPNFIAHSRLVTTDIAATYTIFWACLYLYYLLKNSVYTWKHIFILGFLSTLALLSKYTAVLAISPLYLVLYIAEYQRSSITAKSRVMTVVKKLALSLKYPLILFAVMFVLLIAAYGFRFRPLIEMSYGNTAKEEGNIHGLRETFRDYDDIADLAVSAYKTVPMPFPQYANGFYENVFKHNLFGHSSFLLGEFSDKGWFSYFPVSFVLKEPLGTLGLLLMSICLFAVTALRKQWRAKLHSWALITPFALVLLFSLKSSLNLGIRHIIPLFPFIFLFIAITINSAFTLVEGKRNLIIAVSFFILINIVSIVSAYPHYIGYFNESIGSMTNGYKYLRDSSYDWSQNELYVINYIGDHPENVYTQTLSLKAVQESDYLIIKTKTLYSDPEDRTDFRQYILDGLETGDIKIVDEIAHTHFVLRF